MTVYVDDMCLQVPGEKSHLVADTRSELLSIVERMRDGASRVGALKMKRQGTAYECFMLTADAREAAIRAGAVAIRVNQLMPMLYRREDEGQLGSPNSAGGWFLKKLRREREKHLMPAREARPLPPPKKPVTKGGKV